MMTPLEMNALSNIKELLSMMDDKIDEAIEKSNNPPEGVVTMRIPQEEWHEILKIRHECERWVKLLDNSQPRLA